MSSLQSAYAGDITSCRNLCMLRRYSLYLQVSFIINLHVGTGVKEVFTTTFIGQHFHEAKVRFRVWKKVHQGLTLAEKEIYVQL